MGHKNPYLSSLLVTCHQSSRLYGVRIDIHNAYICIQNSIGMFQVGFERWFVLSIEAI